MAILLAAPALLAPTLTRPLSGMSGDAQENGAGWIDDDAGSTPLQLWITHEPTSGGTRWLLTDEAPPSEHTFFGRSGFPAPGDPRSVKVWIDAVATDQIQTGPADSAEATLRLSSVTERFIAVRAALFLDYEKVGEADDTAFFWPRTPAVEPVVGERGWNDVTLAFSFPAVMNPHYARVLVELEMSPGADWAVRTDGSSGLALGTGG